MLAKIKELSKQLDQERGVPLPGQVWEEPSQRVIVVANRLPVTPRRSKETGEWIFERSSGGLVSALLGVPSIEITWVGWIGIDVPLDEREELTRLMHQQKPFKCVPVFLEAETADHFYNGYCNNVLWPLLHYIPLSMLDAQAQLTETQWAAYQRANQDFADTVMSLEPDQDDLVWVQDYHLMLLPRFLRERMPSLSIGWFLHTPFCTSEMYRTLGHREEILRGVLSADLCGFHIYDFARHFHTSCARVLGTGGAEGVTEGNEGIYSHATRRSTAVDAFPIGIDPGIFMDKLQTGPVKDKIIELQRRFDGKKVILGIDRLDYVKGIPHKLKAMEKFLQTNPKMKGKIVLLQIAVPSRGEVPGYQKLRSNVHKLVSRINGEYGTLEDVPIHYLDQSMKFEELCALYFRAEVMFVTSLRDGMNLVSFEYIACQEKNRGVLVLSEFAGAAQALGAGALLINPYNTDEVAQALDQALNMPKEERDMRFQYMSNHINTHTAQAWAEKFISSLRHAAQASAGEYDSGPFSNLDEAQMLNNRDVITSYKNCERTGGRRLLVFGLLGTLTDYARFANLDKILPSLRRNLAALASNDLNTVVVCSGRERALMNEWLGDLPLWLVAENGLYIRAPGAPGEQPPPWEMTMLKVGEELDDTWMEQVKPVFKYFETRTPDTLTEVQEHTMTWHFQEADEDFAEIQAGDLQAHLVKVCGNAPVEVGLDMKRVEVRPYGVSKGTALSIILERLSEQHDLCEEADGTSPVGGASKGGENRHPSPPHLGVPAAAAEESRPATPRVSASASPAPDARGAEGATPDERERHVSHFRWVLCMSEVMARDEDLFTTIKELAEEDESITAITCCVGKTLSQAEFHLAPLGSQESGETAGVLDLLAHASIDVSHESAALSPAVAPNPSRPQRPSTLERLRELAHLLVGKQLVFLLDFEDLGVTSLHMSEITSRFISLYPTAVVRRNPIPDPDPGLTEDSLSSKVTQLIEREQSESEPSGTTVPLLGPISGIEMSPFSAKPLQRYDRDAALRVTKRAAAAGSVFADSYRPALESCLSQLQAQLEGQHGAAGEQVMVQDDTFLLSVIHRGASEEEVRIMRGIVAETLVDLPMLRSVERRMVLEVRPNVDWNRAHAVEWLVSSVVEQVGVKGAMPIYIGTDTDFSHISACNGLYIPITGGPGADGYFLRSTSQVEELLRWFSEMHAAGVTVRGGRLRPQKQKPPGSVSASGSFTNLSLGSTSRRA